MLYRKVILVTALALVAATLGFFAARNHHLSQEKERSARFPTPVSHVERLCNEGGPGAAAEPLLAAADGNAAADTETVIARLQNENECLRAELKNAKARLAAHAAASSAGLKTVPETPAVQFYSPRLLAAYQDVAASTSKVRTLAALKPLSEYAARQDLELIPILQEAMRGGDADVCRTAMQMLSPYESPAILPALEQALANPDEQTRLMALTAAANVNDPQVVALMEQALNSPDENVRARALEIVEDQPPPLQLLSLEKGLFSSYPDVRSESLSGLLLRGDKAALETVLSGLQSSDGEFRQQVNETLRFLIDQEFETYEEAVAWWNVNQSRYDDDLVEK